MLNNVSLYGIYRAKETHLALKLASIKCHIPYSVLENARKIKTGTTTKYMINFFPVWSEPLLNLILPIFANTLSEQEKTAEKTNMKTTK